MKHYSAFIILVIALFTVIMCSSSSKTVEYDQNEQLFISELNGGSKAKGFRVLETEKAFREEYIHVKSGNTLSAEPVVPSFPKGQKVVLYNLGEFRSGDHKVLGIDSLKVENEVLQVYIKNQAVKPGRGMMEIQIVTTPWIMFSVPADYKFENVVLIPRKI